MRRGGEKGGRGGLEEEEESGMRKWRWREAGWMKSRKQRDLE